MSVVTNIAQRILARVQQGRCRADINLKAMPDGFGFIYGDGIDARGDSRRINIMPRLPYWRGDIKLDTNGPHATDWVLYVDGDEVARALSRAELETALERFLQEPSS